MDNQLTIIDFGVTIHDAEYKPVFFKCPGGSIVGYCPVCRTEVYANPTPNDPDRWDAWNIRHRDYYGKRMCPVCNKNFDVGALPERDMPTVCGILVGRWEKGTIDVAEVMKHPMKPSKDFTCHEGCC